MSIMKSAIYMDNKKFDEVEFRTEEEFENIVKNNHKTLFGLRTIYIDLKSRIDSKSFGGAIPDGILFDFSDKDDPQFYLVEVELQRHDFYKHIFPQITKFFAFFKNSTSRNNLIERIHSVVRTNVKLENEFREYLGKTEIYKTIKDTMENSQNILLVIDEQKSEFKELSEIYTDTWDKFVKIEVLKVYRVDNKTIFTLTPDFEDIEFIEQPSETEEYQKYTEAFHLEGVGSGVVSAYNAINESVMKMDNTLIFNPQKYYISIKKNRNFAYIHIRKKNIKLVIMLPYQTGSSIIKNHKLKQLTEGVQNFYGAPCFEVTIENTDNFEEIIEILREVYRNQNK